MWSRRFIVALVGDAEEARSVRSLANSVRAEMVFVTTVDELLSVRSGDIGAVVCFGGRNERQSIAALNAIRSFQPRVGCVVLLHEQAKGGDFTTILSDGGSIMRVPARSISVAALISRAFIKSVGAAIEEETLVTCQCHPILRTATRYILRSVYCTPDVESLRGARSLTSIAGAAGTSRDYLSRLSKARNYPIRRVPSRWLIVQAAIVKDLEGGSWERIAWRCGFESAAGLSDLCCTQTGFRLSRLSEIPVPGVVSDFTLWLSRGLMGEPE